MKKQIFIVWTLVSMTLFYQCHGCKHTDCGNGYEDIDGVCTCPVGKYEAGNLCKALAPNEYYGFSTECLCMDTAFFEIGTPVEDTLNQRFTVEITKRFGYARDVYNIGELKLRFDYYDLPSGKVLYGHNGVTPGCPINGASGTQTTYQAWYIGADSIKFLEINQTIALIGDPMKDTCVWYLHR